jgi:hypothetical protein
MLQSSDGAMSAVFNLCLEIGYDALGRFSSTFSGHADEIDSDLAHRRLGEVGAPREDPRWTWSYISPLHPSECRHYSLLASGTLVYPDEEAKGRSASMRADGQLRIWHQPAVVSSKSRSPAGRSPGCRLRAWARVPAPRRPVAPTRLD